jgi:hypothetical protein
LKSVKICLNSETYQKLLDHHPKDGAGYSKLDSAVKIDGLINTAPSIGSIAANKKPTLIFKQPTRISGTWFERLNMLFELPVGSRVFNFQRFPVLARWRKRRRRAPLVVVVSPPVRRPTAVCKLLFSCPRSDNSCCSFTCIVHFCP